MKTTLSHSALLLSLLAAVSSTRADERRLEQVIQSARAAEQAAGIQPTGNFSKRDPRVVAYYRCYYTGPLELPESYDRLKLRQGSNNGCSLDTSKYDVFFYPIEAIASGHAPLTQALETAAPQRIATIVPHEDFHLQIEALPDRIAEAAATLVGFVVGASARENHDAELFFAKAKMINRYYDEVSELYKSVRDGKVSKQTALQRKGFLFAEMNTECTSIPGESQSFGTCVSAPNNAGLAFDYTYTKYYPVLYQVFQACRQQSRCTVEAIVNAPKKQSERQAVSYFETFIAAQR